MKKLKIGIDYHGVADKHAIFFAKLTNILVDAGCEVHIITGQGINKELVDTLNMFQIKYTHLFSISDYHKSIGTKVDGLADSPVMDSYLWDRTKADYCEREHIDIHLDDSDVYGKHFKNTIYARVEK